MSNRWGWGAAFAIAASTLVGCATTKATRTVTSVEGESHGKNVDLRVSGQLDAAHGKLRLSVANHVDDAVGVDLDEVRLQTGAGPKAPLGRLQSFRSRQGEKSQRRVALGAITIAPAGHETVELEFEEVPEEATYTLVVPKIYRLGIDGQMDLRAIRLPLHGDKLVVSGGDSDDEKVASADAPKAPRDREGRDEQGDKVEGGEAAEGEHRESGARDEDGEGKASRSTIPARRSSRRLAPPGAPTASRSSISTPARSAATTWRAVARRWSSRTRTCAR